MTLRIISIFLFIITLTACTEAPYNNLSNEQLKTMLAKKEAPILDIRRRDEWKQTGVIKGSKLLTFVDAGGRLKPQFLEKFSAIVGKNDPVILYCQTGHRSDVLARHLVEQLGYTQVYNLRDGIAGWKRDGLPVRRF